MDIPKIIADLQARGWTQQKIAERVQVRQGAISKLALGQRRDMMHSNALRLLALHAEVCGPLEPAETAAQ
jgi:transcriptional regulator with XRE-family HTH domain